jgi:hypothetical protein
MSEKIKGLRSSFNKTLNNIHIHKSSNVRENKIYVSGLIVDIICGEKNTSRFIEGRVFDGGLYLVCGIEKIKNIIAIQLKNMSYDQFRTNYGSDDNIIGRKVSIEANSIDEYSLMAGKVFIEPPYEGKYYQNESINTPVSYGFVMGLTSRREDRMFYNEYPSDKDGETWTLLK